MQGADGGGGLAGLDQEADAAGVEQAAVDAHAGGVEGGGGGAQEVGGEARARPTTVTSSRSSRM